MSRSHSDESSLQQDLRVHAVCVRFENLLHSDEQPKIEEFVRAADPDLRSKLLKELLLVELEFKGQVGESDLQQFLSRFPDQRAAIQAAFQLHTQAAGPTRISRYRIEKLLGKGGFGLVYLGWDEQLDRPVAIKVPHKKLLAQPQLVDAYLAEARTVANLDHLNIVPVYDVGATAEYPCFVVSKYIAGHDLASRLKERPFEYRAAAELVATVATALHHAHKRGLVHRDVKPGNILIGHDGLAHVVDFGLALREENIGRGPRFAGTPAYMSPEQARGEGHRVDGRSDIFSLGSVLYELLAGRRPFRADSQAELLEQISHEPPDRPRRVAPHIPQELERICLKALEKRASQRYTTALDMAEDLRHFLKQHRPSAAEGSDRDSTRRNSNVTPVATNSGTAESARRRPATHIVPKGLRSFDAHDADFFLELLPGPRDRDGLPDSLRFWKTRIEAFQQGDAFPIGLIYGPSGCGKSSLVKAGLLPRLSKAVLPIYVEASATGTEPQILSSLHQRLPALAPWLDLKGALSHLRRGSVLQRDEKVLIVLDQFEQWLHAQKNETDTELVRALRQCDGKHLQCLVLVRDDFWLAATRFMRELEVDLQQGFNMALVDLFDLDHARRVLVALGRAFDRLPAAGHALSREQRQFLDESLAGLAENERVVGVRLALFGEMMKGQPWKSSTLRQVGGAQGIGAGFLEETFCGKTAPPRCRMHEHAARAVLQDLLPEPDTDIRGHVRSEDQLLRVSGYQNRRRDFEQLLAMLDGEIRLITPTDPDGNQADPGQTGGARTAGRCFQLTHDYLVPSLREWLTRKQRETQRGRAELRLCERELTWHAKPDDRLLPSALESASICWWTKRRNWTDSQRKMMLRALRRHGQRWGAVLAILICAAIAAGRYVWQERTAQAAAQVEAILSAHGESYTSVVDDLTAVRSQAVSMLHRTLTDPTVTARRRTQAAMGLAVCGAAQPATLVQSIAAADSSECPFFVSHLRKPGLVAVEQLKAAAAQAYASQQWTQQARLAITAWHLGEESIARDMSQSDEPIQRTALIETFRDWHDDLKTLLNRLPDRLPERWRSAICLCIGSVEGASPGAKQAWKSQLEEWFRSARDSGTHSAAQWALKQWQLPQPRVSEAESDERDWYVSRAGATMIRVSAGQFDREIAWPFATGNTQSIRLTQEYWLSSCEITMGLFRRFIADPIYEGAKPAGWLEYRKEPRDRASPSDEHPVQTVSWYGAVMFCNWLSEEEGLEPCYRQTGSNEIIVRTNEVGDEWELIPSANGYRLPTEAQWEYACRAGTTTEFSFGDDSTYLHRYGVCGSTGAAKVGSHLCNVWGFFDMHGNVGEWCQDWYRQAHSATELIDPQGPPTPEREAMRVAYDNLGTWRGPASAAVSAARGGRRTTTREHSIGFRVARLMAATSTSSNSQ